MTYLINAATMTTLKAISQSAMHDAGTILRPVLADDGAGGQTPGTPIQTSATGLFWALRGAEFVRASQLGQRGSYRWAVPIDTDIQVTDQVVLFGLLYNVVWVPPVDYHSADLTVGLEESGQPVPDLSGGDVLIDAYTWIGIGRIPTYTEDIAG